MLDIKPSVIYIWQVFHIGTGYAAFTSIARFYTTKLFDIDKK
jgi:hypothetical protein